jgi:hypothetical protein
LKCLKLHYKMPPRQSKVWSDFKQDVESKIVKCKLCNLEMTYTGGTSNMLNHLKLKHSSDISGWFMHERCDPNVNPWKWWKENSIKYPRLSVLARQYLSILTTSVPSECIFSATGLLVNKLRNRLSSTVVDHVIFLNKNYVPEQADTQ